MTKRIKITLGVLALIGLSCLAVLLDKGFDKAYNEGFSEGFYAGKRRADNDAMTYHNALAQANYKGWRGEPAEAYAEAKQKGLSDDYARALAEALAKP